MDLDELRSRYKILPMWGRLLAAATLGLLPGAYVFMDEGESLGTALAEAQNLEEAARTKFERDRQRKSNLPKLEEQLAFTEEQLLKAKKNLPDTYRIEEILEKAATIAKETGVKLNLFHPGTELKHTDDYPYAELPVATEIEGKFTQIATFFDKVVHLENSIFIKKIDLTRADAALRGNGLAENSSQAKTPYQLAKEARQNLRTLARFDLVVYRSLKEGEPTSDAPAPSGDPGEAPAGAKPVPPPRGGNPGANGDPAGAAEGAHVPSRPGSHLALATRHEVPR